MNKDCSQCIWHDKCDEVNSENVCEDFTPYDTEDEDTKYYINILRESQDDYMSLVEEFND